MLQINALFLGARNDPPNAKSDAATVWPLERLEELLRSVTAVRDAAHVFST